MVSCGISCPISSNCRARSSKLPIRCLPIVYQTCTFGERSSGLAGQGSVFQAPASNDDQKYPAVKRNGTPDHNWLRVCVACNSESRISMLPSASSDTSSMIIHSWEWDSLLTLYTPSQHDSNLIESSTTVILLDSEKVGVEGVVVVGTSVNFSLSDTRMRVTRQMVDNESGTVAADMTINLSSRSAVTLDRPLLS
ncbi:hypothetical protein TNCV_2625371 [Trichonephila clavipes]|nr:hypothetical protein TNCV_2625371 [Trichonephila clavipes]